jgi:hypothetical protein
MYMYIYVYMYTRIHTCIYVYTHVFTYTYTYIYVHTYLYTDTHVRIVYVYTYIHPYIHTCIHTLLHSGAHDSPTASPRRHHLRLSLDSLTAGSAATLSANKPEDAADNNSGQTKAEEAAPAISESFSAKLETCIVRTRSESALGAQVSIRLGCEPRMARG